MDFDEDATSLYQKFRHVHCEIDYIRAKIHQKRGFWFFKSHIYSVDELLESPHHARIYTITAKIGDDAGNWYKCGQLSKEGKKSYD